MALKTADPERRYLAYGAAGNLLIGIIGLAMAVIASSSAISLDGFFNLTYFITALLSLRVAVLVAKGDDERFPYGYTSFEPLINLVKGLLVLTITVTATVGAIRSVLSGGRVIAAGWALAYGFFASTVCWIAAGLMKRGRKGTGSPMLAADAANWLVNAVISTCVLAAFAGAFILARIGADRAVPYVDPVITLVVCVLGISIPVRMSWKALMELLNRAPSPEIIAAVRRVVEECLRDIPSTHRYLRIIQPGRTRFVTVHVVLPKGADSPAITEMDRIRGLTNRRLIEEYPNTVLDVVFTADPGWGAPESLSTASLQ